MHPYTLTVLLFLVATAGRGFAQTCRDPTPAERQVVEKMVHTLQTALKDPLQRGGWTIISEQTALPLAPIAKSPGPVRPLMLCNRALELSLMGEPSGGAPGDNEATIRVTENLPYQHIYVSPSAKWKQLAVPGVALAIQVTEPQEPSRVDTWLYFGNWKNAHVITGNDAYSTPYPFGHPGNTPFIVNLSVHISGSSTTTERIIAAINWSTLNQALTP